MLDRGSKAERSADPRQGSPGDAPSQAMNVSGQVTPQNEHQLERTNQTRVLSSSRKTPRRFGGGGARQVACALPPLCEVCEARAPWRLCRVLRLRQGVGEEV